jgi:hypothetical protein
LALVSPGIRSGLVTVALNLRKSDCKPTRSSRRGGACLRSYAIGAPVVQQASGASVKVQLLNQSYTRLSGFAQAQSFRAANRVGLPLQFASNVFGLVTRSFLMEACGQSAFLVLR